MKHNIYGEMNCNELQNNFVPADYVKQMFRHTRGPFQDTLHATSSTFPFQNRLPVLKEFVLFVM